MNRELTAIMNPQLGEDVLHASNLVKEGLQEIILQSLSETGFFNHALFHGGTCLRILHGLDRFSEDLDFTLREKNTWTSRSGRRTWISIWNRISIR